MNETEYDPAIYSDQSALIPGEDGVSTWQRIPWRQLAEERAEEIARLRKFEGLVLDLDRNENGRHEGDADVGDPTGVSQGNPLMHAGDVIGYRLGGHPYVMPERSQRYDPSAWGAR
jgi:hypothetical protein